MGLVGSARKGWEGSDGPGPPGESLASVGDVGEEGGLPMTFLMTCRVLQ